MKKTTAIVLYVMILAAVILSACSSKVVDEYKDNTEILKNPDMPTASDVNIAEIEGYKEIEIKGLKLPLEVENTNLKILSVGSYTGAYVEDGSMDEVENILAIVVTNTSDIDISYSTFDVRYAESDDAITSFTPTNIPSGVSVCVLSGAKDLTVDKVTRFEISSPMQVLSEKLNMIDGVVGVSYEDDHFILTNLTEDDLGSVYLRYKRIAGGNVFLGGNTFSVTQDDVAPYQTYRVYAPDFDEKTCGLIAVENVDY